MPDRPIPCAVDAEQAALGASLQDPKAAEAVCALLRDGDCYQERHRLILSAIRAVLSKGEHPDLVTVARVLIARHHFKQIGSSAYLAELVDLRCPSPTHHRSYCALVREAAARRRVIDACTRTASAMYDGEASLPEAVKHLSEDVEASLDGAEDSPKTLVPVRLSAALKAWQSTVETRDRSRMVATPIPHINKLLGGGFEGGDLIYLGARPGVGKTALALEIGRTAAEAGVGVLIVSREMVIARLVRRILAQASRIPAGTIKSGLFTDAQYSVLASAYSRLAPLPLWLLDTAVAIEDIVRLVERWPFTPTVGLLIVDYLQLVRAPKDIRDRRLQVEAVSQALKTLAMARGIPVLCVSSLSRPEKGGHDRKPVLQDLRESGELEHDADVILLMHRGLNAEETEVAVAKSRDGRVGLVHLRFKSEFLVFEQADEAE